MKASHEMKYLSPKDKQELLEVMDAHFQTYLRARSLTPYIYSAIIDSLSSCKLINCFCALQHLYTKAWAMRANGIMRLGKFHSKSEFLEILQVFWMLR